MIREMEKLIKIIEELLKIEVINCKMSYANYKLKWEETKDRKYLGLSIGIEDECIFLQRLESVIKEFKTKISSLSIEEVDKIRNYDARQHIYSKLKALEIIKEHKLLNYVLKNEKCANMYHLTKGEINFLKDIVWIN